MTISSSKHVPEKKFQIAYVVRFHAMLLYVIPAAYSVYICFSGFFQFLLTTISMFQQLKTQQQLVTPTF
jgi:hypothetical protein